MVIVGLCGPPKSGKATVARLLEEERGFVALNLKQLGRELERKGCDACGGQEDQMRACNGVHDGQVDGGGQADASEDRSAMDLAQQAAHEALERIMQRWQTPHVVFPITLREEMQIFRRRPFFLLMAVKAPILTRLARSIAQEGDDGSLDHRSVSKSIHGDVSDVDAEKMLSFLREQDQVEFGAAGPQQGPTGMGASVAFCMSEADIELVNGGSLQHLAESLDALDLLNPELTRPSWDTYFMRLAFLAASRSNCMKKSVGALVVKNKKVVSTGYNGTPFGVTNCNEGGCRRCNAATAQGQALEICLCMHAEANALLEAGRERCVGGMVFVTCTPCLGCAKLIIQAGITEVIYALDYDLDSGSVPLLQNSNVRVRRFDQYHPGVSPFPSRPFLRSSDRCGKSLADAERGEGVAGLKGGERRDDEDESCQIGTLRPA
ncbi:unnamed protein product [Vitrella brassicaformis CCMP3155]|uniref:Deoxycytidylate deaminase n=2 Tax=Vitrella brassicaformis TaxID=1169539 RepID=A0A0G4EM20_VITBC|nr:unnamed protein product [Vitrella brassicaformis CCMP3155]|mmetsp:Transcript_24918/g.61654  ORF Transcript_24918/g.61654 Transcript_24918/m.61654 type:complete len:435 (+) Transcript_24918:2306-3610(+)|eukprot:CEL98480.1 unnamed protein product [Vitrella brassicaformis CCMP3155]